MKKEMNNESPKPKQGWLKGLALAGKITTALVVVLVLFWFGFVCEVREGTCAVVLRFGAVREEITEAGVYLKLPWPFETVVTYDQRLQYLESGDLETTTQDKRNIIIQSYVVWQVEDPVLYHNSVGVLGTVDSYIKETVKSATNGTMGGYKLQQLVSMEAEEIRIECDYDRPESGMELELAVRIHLGHLLRAFMKIVKKNVEKELSEEGYGK